MADQRHLVFERGLKIEVAAGRDRVQRLILRLELQRAESKFLGAAADLIAKLRLGHKRIQAGGAGQPIRVAADRLPNLIVRGAVILHHGEGNHQGAVHATAIHVRQQLVRAIAASAVLRHTHMGVRVEDFHSVRHE